MDYKLLRLEELEEEEEEREKREERGYRGVEGEEGEAREKKKKGERRIRWRRRRSLRGKRGLRKIFEACRGEGGVCLLVGENVFGLLIFRVLLGAGLKYGFQGVFCFCIVFYTFKKFSFKIRAFKTFLNGIFKHRYKTRIKTSTKA